MSSAVTAAPAAKSQKKTGPTVSDRILKAVSESTEPSGVSPAALMEALKVGKYDVVKNKARIFTAIKRLLANKILVKTRGCGAPGSFKLKENPPTPRQKKKKKKPKATKVEKATVKKSPQKKRKAKSPKKTKKTKKPPAPAPPAPPPAAPAPAPAPAAAPAPAPPAKK